MTVLSRNNVFLERARKKERKKKKVMNFPFLRSSGLGFDDATASINLPNIIGNAQEYFVILYMSKMNLFVGDRHV